VKYTREDNSVKEAGKCQQQNVAQITPNNFLEVICPCRTSSQMGPPHQPQQNAPPPAPDSPRLSQSPPPEGSQGDLELELMGLANALYNLGTTIVSDSTKERDKPGGGKPVGLRV